MAALGDDEKALFGGGDGVNAIQTGNFKTQWGEKHGGDGGSSFAGEGHGGITYIGILQSRFSPDSVPIQSRFSPKSLDFCSPDSVPIQSQFSSNSVLSQS